METLFTTVTLNKHFLFENGMVIP